MQRIALDTIGPMDICKDFRFIIVVIDTFTRYVELFPAYDVTEAAATDALSAVRNPPEIVTDQGSQFMNQTLQSFATLTGVWYHRTIPYSKEKNGIVEREIKVNRHIRNILAGQRARRRLAPNDLYDAKAPEFFSQETVRGIAKHPTLRQRDKLRNKIKDMNQQNDTVTPRSIREYVDKLMHHLGKQRTHNKQETTHI